MKIVKIRRLEVKNFKGVEAFSLSPGDETFIYGDNATGKTSLYDAFTWLLFGKDSLDRADFEIKPIREGLPEHGVETDVKAVLIVGDEETELRRVYYEKWTKKRGQPKAIFTGHSTDYYLDGVPVKAKEYADAVVDVCKLDLFKLLTNPRHFNEALSWQDRRKMLIEVCGDISDEDVLSTNKDLTELPEIIGKHTLEDFKKVVVGRRSEINKDLSALPVRIDEANNSIVNVDQKEKEIEHDLKTVTAEIKTLREELSQIESGGELAIATKRLHEIEAEIMAHDNAKAAKSRLSEDDRLDQMQIVTSEINKRRSELERFEMSIDVKTEAIEKEKKSVAGIEDHLKQLRQQWNEADSLKFSLDDYEGSDTCPTCGQPLPEEKLDAAIAEAEAQYNEKKAAKLEDITSRGKAKKAEIETARKKIEDLSAAIEQEREKISANRVDIADLSKRLALLEKAKGRGIEVVPDQARAQMEAARDGVRARIIALKSGVENSTLKLREKLDELDQKQAGLGLKKMQIEQNKRSEERIKELKAQERELAAEYEKIEGQLYLCEQFTRAKVSMLTDQINGKFGWVKFKLFEDLINGGVSECCEALDGGVPYWSMNNAARTQAGIEISNVLQKHHGLSMPIWVDNRESITELPKIDCQVISLVVSSDHKTLSVQEVLTAYENPTKSK